MISMFHAVGFAVLLYAAAYDWKYREVPDMLSYGLIIAVIGMSIIKSITTQMWSPLWSTLLIGIIFYGVGLALFYTGQWGGGDSKLLIGSAMLFASYLPYIFFVLLLAVGAIYGTIYALSLFITNYKQSFPMFYRLTKRGSTSSVFTACIIISLISLLAGIFSTATIAMIFFSISFTAIFVPFIWVMTKSVEETAMKVWMPVAQITEGEWLAQDVKQGKKTILKIPALGMEQKDIDNLKKHNIKQVLVKKGIPFVPSFFFAYLITYFYGSQLLALLPL